MKLCLPIQEKSQQKILDIFEKQKGEYDLFEVWLDSIKDLNIGELIKNCPKPILCVCKGLEEKGAFERSEQDRVNMLIQSAQAGADFIDVGIHTDKKLIKKLFQNKEKSKVILSYHNWEKTPKLTTMLSIISEMLKFQPDFVKYVGYAQKVEDNIHIFRLAENLKKKGIKFIVMCMGRHGKISRVVSPIFGTEWMYAPADLRSSSAPGQIVVKDLQVLLKTLLP